MIFFILPLWKYLNFSNIRLPNFKFNACEVSIFSPKTVKSACRMLLENDCDLKDIDIVIRNKILIKL